MVLRQIIIVPFRAIIHFTAMILWMLVVMIVGLLNPEAGFTIFLRWIEFVKRLYDIDVQLVNDNDANEELKGCVFTLLNQSSLLDGLVALRYIPRPCRGIVNIEFALMPFFGWVIGMINYVIVRQWPSQAKNTLSKVEAFLRDDGNIWMSIEGKRSKDSSLSEFKKGPVVMAIQSEAKIVPVIISGTREVLGYGTPRIRAGKIKVRFLEVIHTKGLGYNNRQSMVEQLTAIAEREVPKEMNGIQY